MSFALTVENLTKRFGSGVLALDAVNLRIAQGDFFALLGPNGAGKSTLISILCSLVKKSSGKVRIFDLDIDRDFALARRHLGVVPQEFNFNGFEKVEDIVVNQAGYYGIARANARKSAERYLKKLGLWEKRAQPARFLSGGMKRRLMIARALVHEPDILILDEPTAGVDIELRRSMWTFLTEVNAEGTTIVLTTHYLEEAEQLCRNVAILNNGKILENASMAGLLAKLNREVFVLDIAERAEAVDSLNGFEVLKSSPTHIEVALDRGQNLNDLYSELSRRDVKVQSMRNKANRLEELFVSIVQSPGQGL